MLTTIPSDEIRAAAAGIANARAGRRGAPPVSNVLEMLESVPRFHNLVEEVLEDAAAALEAVETLRAKKASPEPISGMPESASPNTAADG